MALAASLLAACSGSDEAFSPPTTSARRPPSAPPTRLPAAAAIDRFVAAPGPLTRDVTPSRAPVQAGEVLRGVPLPTNQWWTSALTGPFTENLWAHPLVVRAGPDGLAVGAALAVDARRDVIEVPIVPSLVVGGPLSGIEVTGYGSHSVELRLLRSGRSALVAHLAQGSPTLSISVPDGDMVLHAVGASVSIGGRGVEPASPATPVNALSADRVVVNVGGHRWDVASTGPAHWTFDGAELRATSGGPILVTLAPQPLGGDASWDEAFAGVATRPVVSTTSEVEVDWAAGVVRQRLTWERPAGGPGLVALLPHQRAALVDAGPVVSGGYRSAVGDLTLVRADAVTLAFPLDGFLPGVPTVDAVVADDATAAAILDDLRADLSDTAVAGGSYGGPKALGRVALLAELARALGASEEEAALVEVLDAGLSDWLRYDGADDARWLAAEPLWGGIVAHPSEYGNADYNDHHFQYAYLIRAAATLAELAPERVLGSRRSGVVAMVDRLVADVLGGGSGFPPFRVFNAYLGHSIASGFSQFAAGGNQESSSEAVHAWEAIARWGLTLGRDDLVDAAVARWAIEAATARAYWLGELDGVRAPGYAHRSTGIVWGGKVDFATFFDGRPEAVIGIQLLPFTFGSLYRHGDRPAAAERVAAAREAAAGDRRPILWADLFVMEEALADPRAAARSLATLTEVEAGNSRALLRYWVEALGTLGRTSTSVRAAGPGGWAFDGPGGTTLVARNVGRSTVSVPFVTGDGDVVATLVVSPGGTVVDRRP